MTKRSDPQEHADAAVDGLIGNLLDCAGMLSRILNHMEQFSAAGLSAPDLPPSEVILHELVKGVVQPVAARRSQAELKLASAVVDEFTKAMCSEILLVPVDGEIADAIRDEQ
jgi:hypothetical protein